VALGTVDVGMMLYEWALANKATYVGAHRAIVSNPVASNLATVFDDTITGNMGLRCADPATGNANGNCMTFPKLDCTSTTPCTICTSPPTPCTPTPSPSYGYDSTAFTNIFTPMQQVFPRLQPTNVTISYERPAELNNLGFNEPNGFPIAVTVKITGLTHQFYFIDGLVRFFGGFINSTPSIPEYKTTLIGEDMCTDAVGPTGVCGF
jgi:hypothetical protein